MIEVYRRAAISRAFEEEVYKRVKSKQITCPVYLSSGQEYIAATISYFLGHHKPAIFPQHRNHSTYLSFGGSMSHLIRELTGGDTGMQGSASISDGDIFGHDGMMGSNVPISVGYAHATKRPTICFFGDAAAEEDYVLASFGWAATGNAPVLFVCEDNNLAILTEKKVRRSWDVADVSRGFGISSYDITDSPQTIARAIAGYDFKLPMLLNIHTVRKYWHAGAGQDGDWVGRYIPDSEKINEDAIKVVKDAWNCATQ